MMKGSKYNMRCIQVIKLRNTKEEAWTILKPVSQQLSFEVECFVKVSFRYIFLRRMTHRKSTTFKDTVKTDSEIQSVQEIKENQGLAAMHAHARMHTHTLLFPSSFTACVTQPQTLFMTTSNGFCFSLHPSH